MKSFRDQIFEATGFDHLSPINIARDRKLRAYYEKYINAPDVESKAAAYEAFKSFVLEEYCGKKFPDSTVD